MPLIVSQYDPKTLIPYVKNSSLWHTRPRDINTIFFRKIFRNIDHILYLNLMSYLKGTYKSRSFYIKTNKWASANNLPESTKSVFRHSKIMTVTKR